MTLVTVSRDQEIATMSLRREIDEAKIFKGEENRLTMKQTYTFQFQCKYDLKRYPFDTQVHPEYITDPSFFALTSGV